MDLNVKRKIDVVEGIFDSVNNKLGQPDELGEFGIIKYSIWNIDPPDTLTTE